MTYKTLRRQQRLVNTNPTKLNRELTHDHRKRKQAVPSPECHALFVFSEIPMGDHERGNDGIVITSSGTYP
jgi:hypothetical protein